MRRAALLWLAVVAVPQAMQGQACAGQAPWSAGAFKVGGELGLGSSTSLVGGAAIGKDAGPFGGAAIGIETDGGTATRFQANGGFELKPVAEKLHLCPIADLLYETDSEEGISVNVFEILAGVSAGYPLKLNSDKMRLFLTGAFELGNAHLSVEDCDLCSANDFLGVLDAGVGLIVNNRISLVPQLRFPISSDADVSFRLRANLAVGKGH